MKDKDYTVKADKQSGYINTECKSATELVTKCIICGNDVVISVWDNAPKVCEDCKKAIAYAKNLWRKKTKDKENEFMLCPYCRIKTKLIEDKCSNCGTLLFRCSYDVNQEVEVLEDRQDG